MWHWFGLMSPVLSSHICLSFTCGNWQTPNLLESPLDAGTCDTSASLHQPVLADCLTGTWQSTVTCSTTSKRRLMHPWRILSFWPKGTETLLNHWKVHISHIYLILLEIILLFCFTNNSFSLIFAFQMVNLGSQMLHLLFFLLPSFSFFKC